MMNVRDQRDFGPCFANFRAYFLQAPRLRHCRCGDPDYFATDIVQGQNLPDAGIDVARLFGDHALHNDRAAATYGDLTYGNGYGCAPRERHLPLILLERPVVERLNERA